MINEERDDKHKPYDSKITSCPECGGAKLMRDYDAAEIVCIACGYVIDEKLADPRPEWRAFDDEQREKRTRVELRLLIPSMIKDYQHRSIGEILAPQVRMDQYLRE